MNWRVIRWILVIILLILNIGLFGYSVYQKRQLYVVPTERIECVRERFEEWGYQLPKEISRRQYPKKRLILEVTDLEDRANAFWSEDYEKSYMPGSRILYTCGTQTLTVDREQSSMVVTENDPDYQNALEKVIHESVVPQQKQRNVHIKMVEPIYQLLTDIKSMVKQSMK